MNRDRSTPPPAGEPFDLDRVRQNWSRVAPPERAELPPRMAEVRAPEDALATARALFDRVCKLASSELRDRASTLAPFFDRARTRLQALERGDGDRAALRSELTEALCEIEDLIEVFTGIGR